MLNLGDCINFSDLFSVCLKTIDHFNLKLWIFSGHTASFKIKISKVQDFGNFELSPMYRNLNKLFLLYSNESGSYGGNMSQMGNNSIRQVRMFSG